MSRYDAPTKPTRPVSVMLCTSRRSMRTASWSDAPTASANGHEQCRAGGDRGDRRAASRRARSVPRRRWRSRRQRRRPTRPIAAGPVPVRCARRGTGGRSRPDRSRRRPRRDHEWRDRNVGPLRVQRRGERDGADVARDRDAAADLVLERAARKAEREVQPDGGQQRDGRARATADAASCASAAPCGSIADALDGGDRADGRGRDHDPAQRLAAVVAAATTHRRGAPRDHEHAHEDAAGTDRDVGRVAPRPRSRHPRRQLRPRRRRARVATAAAGRARRRAGW